MPNAQRPERETCSRCGYPLRGLKCEACGAEREPLGTDSVGGQRVRPSPDRDAIGLDLAGEAFKAKDFARALELVITADGGGSARSAPAGDATGWIAVIGGGLVFAVIRGGDLVLEAPVVRLPLRQRAPVLRAALELTAREPVTSRFCLRGDRLILRFSAPALGLTPVLIRQLLRELGHLATRYAEVLGVGFDALAAIPDERRGSAGFDALGEPRALVFAGDDASMPPSTSRTRVHDVPPPVAPIAAPHAPIAHAPTAPAPMTSAPIAGASMPVGTSRRESTSEVKRLEVAGPVRGRPLIPREEEETPAPAPADSIPAVLAPMLVGVGAGGNEERRRAVTAQEPSRRLTSGGMPAARVSMPEIELDAPTRRTGGSSELAVQPADRLVALLQKAQQLASATLEARPATMAWLVRSTVFRAIFEFKDSLPDAVAHLFRCTGIARETRAASRSSGSLPPAEPFLPVLERVIAARGAVPKEGPFTVEPMTSAAQVKEHVGRYIVELERSPSEIGLRHFLATGALVEVLVRTKLPSATDQRLREIVVHAQREGAKPQAVELLMTSLQRFAS